jgi:hypothetical protein
MSDKRQRLKYRSTPTMSFHNPEVADSIPIVLDLGLFHETSLKVTESQTQTRTRMTTILSYMKSRLDLY